MKRKLQTTFLALLLSLSVAAAPSVWADDFDDDDLGVGSFDVLDDSDSEEGSLLELHDLGNNDNDHMDSDSEDEDSDSEDSDSEDSDSEDSDSEDFDSDDSDGDLDDSDSEDDSDEQDPDPGS